MTAWSASLQNLRQHLNQAKPPPKEEIVRIVGKPRECFTDSCLRGQRTRRTALSADGQTKHGSVISVMPGIDKLLELALEAGQRSGWWAELQSQRLRPTETFRESVFAGMGRPDEKKVNTMMRAFTRWRSWLCNQTVHGHAPFDAFQPIASIMADFLACATAGGKTAASSLYATLRMVESHVLLDLQLEAKLCKGWATPLPSHKTKQQLVLDLNELVHFETLVRKNQSPQIIMACAEILLCVYGCMRPVHLQRSYLIDTTEYAYVFECIEGKARSGTQRLPFIWVLPRQTLLGWDIMPRVVEHLRLKPPEGEAPWLLRQWGPSHTAPNAATYFISPDAPLQPFQSRAARKQIMQWPPLRLSCEAASANAAYRGRRVLVLWASAIKLDGRESAALSNWRVSGDKVAKTASLSMQCLYDHSKVEQQCTTKYQCILAMSEAVQIKDDFNLPWSDYTGIAKHGSEYLDMARSKSSGLKPADGISKARLEGSRLPFKPSELNGTPEPPGVQSPFAPWGDPLQQMGLSDSPQHKTHFSPSSSRASSPDGDTPEDAEEEKYMKKVSIAQDLQVVYSRAQRTARVHLYHAEADTDYGRASRCNSRIAVQNAEICSAWEVSRNMASLTWCPKCRTRWPPEVADVLLN